MSTYLERQFIPNKTSSPEDFKPTTFDSMCCNPFKPSVLFVGHRQTVETQTRRRRTQCLIRVSTVCLQNVLSKFEQK